MLKLRRVTPADLDLIFQWANDKECRENSFSTKKIPYERHCQWFKKKLEDKDSHLFVLEKGNLPIGMLRFDYQGDCAEISYSIAREHRGKGYGKKILTLGEEYIREWRTENWLKAQVKKENIVSRHLFLSLVYREKEKSDCVEYSKKVNRVDK